MKTTVTYRSHWIDASGRCYAQRHPFTAAQLTPVVNLDEVRGWLEVACSDAMRHARFPGSLGTGDPAHHGMQLALDLAASGVEIPGHLAQAICGELTDEVPRYHESDDADWRTPFAQMCERWPLPALGGPAAVRNLTPHAVRVGEVEFAPSGAIARALEEATPAAPICVARPLVVGALTIGSLPSVDVPTCTTRYIGLADLPAPQPGVYLIVSMVIPPVAAQQGRWTGDLLVPGEQVRDPQGRIIGCRSLQRAA